MLLLPPRSGSVPLVARSLTIMRSASLVFAGLYQSMLVEAAYSMRAPHRRSSESWIRWAVRGESYDGTVRYTARRRVFAGRVPSALVRRLRSRRRRRQRSTEPDDRALIDIRHPSNAAVVRRTAAGGVRLGSRGHLQGFTSRRLTRRPAAAANCALPDGLNGAFWSADAERALAAGTAISGSVPLDGGAARDYGPRRSRNPISCVAGRQRAWRS